MDISTLNKRLLKLALPNILTNVTIPLLGIVDLALVGRLKDPAVVGGVAIATTIFNLLYWNFSFLRMGSTGLTAQALGANDNKAIGRVLGQSLLLSLLFGLLILLFQSPIRDLLLGILNPESSLEDYAVKYYNIVIWSAPAMLLIYTLSGWIIGLQNTWWPMTVSITANVLNIVLSAYLVICKEWGIVGVAVGTLVAQWISALSLLFGAWYFYIRKSSSTISLPSSITELLEGLGRYFDTNVYIFLRTITLASVSFYFTYAGTVMGALVLAGNALLYQFFSIFSYFIDGFANAAEALVGQVYGSRDRISMVQSVKILIVWGVILALLMTFVYMAGGVSFVQLLNNQPEVREMAYAYLNWVWLLPFAGFLSFLMDGIYIGLTASKEMFYSMLLAAVLFFVLFNIQPFSDPNDSLWFAFNSYLVVRGLTLVLILPRYMRKRYYIGIGTTLIYTKDNIVALLQSHFGKKALRFSHFYETNSVDNKNERLAEMNPRSKIYLNSVVELRKNEDVESLRQVLKQLEIQAGRRSGLNNENKEVVLDLDLVVMDNQILRPNDFRQPYFQEGYSKLQ